MYVGPDRSGFKIRNGSNLPVPATATVGYKESGRGMHRCRLFSSLQEFIYIEIALVLNMAFHGATYGRRYDELFNLRF